jgi:hypothetical protein
MSMLRQRWQNFIDVLKPMTPKQKLDHLWTYYKAVPITLLAIIFFLSSLIPGIIESRKEVLFGGLSINFNENDRMKSCLIDELFVFFGGTDSKKQHVTLNTMSLSTASEDLAALYDEHTAIAAQIAAKELDYIILDTTSVEFFSNMDVMADLNTLLTAQQLQTLNDRLLYRTSTEGKTYPFAIDLSGTAFAQACNPIDGAVYIIFPGNTERAGKTAQFLDYILNWQ